MFKLFEDGRVVFVILCFSHQLGKLCDVMVDVACFHLQFVEFRCCFVVSIRVIPILDEVLLKFFPHIYVGRGGYRSSHNPIFHASSPLGDCGSLDEGEGVCDFAVGIGHNVGVGVEELIEFEFMHELIGSCSVAGEDGGFLALQLPVPFVTDDRNRACTHGAKAKPEGSDEVRNCRCKSREHDAETSHA